MRVSLCLILTLCGLMWLLAGCGGGGGSTPQTGSGKTLTGRIVDAVTQNGVAGANLTLLSNRQRGRLAVTTNARGEYTFSDAPIGEATLTANLPDGASWSIDLEIPQSRDTVSAVVRACPASVDPPTAVTLAPATPVSIHVGEVQQFTATVAPDPAVLPTYSLIGDIGSLTADGLFIASKVGTGAVRATAGDIVTETPVTVAAGSAATGTVTGLVLDKDGRPIPGVTLSHNTGAAVTGIDGTYVFAGLAPGVYVLNSVADGYPATTKTVRVNAGVTTFLDWALVSANTPPTATCTLTPKSGTTTTSFAVDASACCDAEDQASTLQVRWDWDGDGVWDTTYDTTKTATHTYPAAGDYTIKLQVKDSGGLVDTTTDRVTVIDATGTVTVRVAWPDRNRFIPNAVNSMVIELEGVDGYTSTSTVSRPDDSTVATSTMQFNDVPPGNVKVTVTAYPTNDGTGSPLAIGATNLMVVAGEMVPVQMNLTAAIERVEVSVPAGTVVTADTVQCIATARDANGDIVLVQPDGISWMSSASAVATVAEDGTVSTVKTGTVTISATERESGITGSIELSVQLGGRRKK